MKPSLLELFQVDIYQKKRLILHHVDLEVRQQEWVFLIGKTGSGKSALFQTLWADYLIKKGKGQVMNFDLNDLDQENIPFLRRRLAIFHPELELIPNLTIEENLLLALEVTDWEDNFAKQERIEQLLVQTLLLPVRHKKPAEINRLQYRTALLARAIANNPSLWLLDEPTTQLDTEARQEFCQLLLSLAKQYDASILWGTHNESLLQYQHDKCYHCDGGRVVLKTS